MSRPALFLDTGYLIALHNTDDRHHAAAARWRAELAEHPRPIVTTTAVLAEAGDGFAKRGRWDRIASTLDALTRDATITIIPLDLGWTRRAIERQNQRADQRWGPTDCTSFLAMEALSITDALACDRDFVQAGFNALLLEE